MENLLIGVSILGAVFIVGIVFLCWAAGQFEEFLDDG